MIIPIFLLSRSRNSYNKSLFSWEKSWPFWKNIAFQVVVILAIPFVVAFFILTHILVLAWIVFVIGVAISVAGHVFGFNDTETLWQAIKWWQNL